LRKRPQVDRGDRDDWAGKAIWCGTYRYRP
jgi:hypothetical protein